MENFTKHFKRASDMGISSTCVMCYGTGLMKVANGEDDYDLDYCGCEDGALLRSYDEKKYE